MRLYSEQEIQKAPRKSMALGRIMRRISKQTNRIARHNFGAGIRKREVVVWFFSATPPHQ
jgi:hypothetical protein